MTTPHRLTCSGLALAEFCTWSFRPDADVRGEVDLYLKNTAVHEANAHTIRSGSTAFVIPAALEDKLTEGDLAWAQRVHTAWVVDWYEDQKHHPWRAEIAFAFDPLGTGTMVVDTEGKHRNYSKVPTGWIPGTVDVIREDAPGDVIIEDWKSSRWPSYADGNAQLAGLGLAADARYLRGAIGHCTEDGVRVEWASYDRFALDDWRDRFARIVRSVPTSEPVPGSHCRDLFCNSFGLCPATKGSLAIVSPETAEVVEHGDVKRRLPIVMASSAFMDADHAAAQYIMLREADARWTEIKRRAFEAVRFYAEEHGGIQLPGGKVYRKVEQTREAIDLSRPEAIEALGRELGEDGLKLATTTETVATKSSIKIAARANKEKTGETIASCEERALKALRAVGAVKVSKVEKYEETKAAPAALTEGKNDAA